jgi:hypothetical protein
MCGGLQVDGFAFGHLATNFQWYLQSNAHCLASFWVSCAVHKLSGTGGSGASIKEIATMPLKKQVASLGF